MEFQYILPKKIVFGRGKLNELNNLIEGIGKRLFIVSGNSSIKNGTINRIKGILNDNQSVVGNYVVCGEPTCTYVDECRFLIEESGADLVIGLGGGSALDVAKAAAGLMGQSEETSVYLNKAPFDYKGMSFVGIPTTSGTGSEITLNAVLYNPITGNKASIAHPCFQAELALVDPELTYTMPKAVVASAGMDALTHAIESHASSVSNIGTRLYTEKSIKLISESLVDAVAGNEDALDKLALGSMYAALGFAQTGVGIAHAISHPLGAIFHIPHGVINAILLKEACWFNRIGNEAIYDEIADLMDCDDLYGHLNKLVHLLPIPNNLSVAGYKKGHEIEILEMTFQSRSLKKNPRLASEGDIMMLIERCLDAQ